MQYGIFQNYLNVGNKMLHIDPIIKFWIRRKNGPSTKKNKKLIGLSPQAFIWLSDTINGYHLWTPCLEWECFHLNMHFLGVFKWWGQGIFIQVVDRKHHVYSFILFYGSSTIFNGGCCNFYHKFLISMYHIMNLMLFLSPQHTY